VKYDLRVESELELLGLSDEGMKCVGVGIEVRVMLELRLSVEIGSATTSPQRQGSRPTLVGNSAFGTEQVDAEVQTRQTHIPYLRKRP
jgi:hypothetical protein